MAERHIDVRVLFFARARDLSKVPEAVIRVPEGSNLSDVKDRVGEAFPALHRLFEERSTVLSLNGVYPDDSRTAVVQEGDEIAVIPPVSGG